MASCAEEVSIPSRVPLVFSAICVLALAGIYTIFHYHTHDLEELQRATGRLLQGETHWITFQNRVFAPAIVQLLQSLTGWSWMRAFYVLEYACMASGGLLLIWRARTRRLGTAVGFAQASAWFLLGFVFNDGWSYPWDYVGALLNLALLIWALDHFSDPSRLWSWPPMAILAGLALNRESSLIAIAALLLAVLAGSLRRERRWPWHSVLPLTGAGLVNLSLVVWLRQALFVRSTRPTVTGPVHELVVGNFMQLRDNLELLLTRSHPAPIQLTVVAIAILLASLTAVMGWRGWTIWQSGTPVHPGEVFALSYLVMGIAAIVVFAAMQELRVYFELIPFLVLLGTQATQDSPVARPAR